MEITPEQFRHVIGHMPTGVTIVTAMSPDGPIGMSANAVTSLSLEPPLMLLCPAKSSTTWPGIRAARRFCINVMAGHHADLVRRFSRRGIDRFADLELTPRQGGPALGDAVAWIDCSIRGEYDGGDHHVVVADVLHLDAAADSVPLVFFRGGYGSFQPDGS